jgi:hypothetical protein
LQRTLGRATEPRLLFPLLAVFLLTVMWVTTVGLIRVKHADAQHAAAGSSRELLGTYEAQVVRALREIDLTLNLVKYWHEQGGGLHVLSELRNRGLLPPDLLFVVSIADRDGTVVDSTQPRGIRHVADQDYFREQLDSGTLFIGRPPRHPVGEAKLHFSRRLDANGAFDGVVIVTVSAAYFVSGYESSKLGEHGVLGLLGADGTFWVRRTGDALFFGDTIDYASVVPRSDVGDAEATASTNSWDGVRRWTVARELYGFPLAVLVGLSTDEQAAGVRRITRSYLWRAGLASVLAMLLLALLGRMSRQLAQSRLRESEAKMAHARRIEYLAYHDGLTGLPNRSLFSKLLTQSISGAHRYDKQLAVAFLDLDRFKQINDTLGHEAGDELLQEVAKRLKGCVRDNDTVARLGGDEFVVLLPELSDAKQRPS